MVIVKAPIDYTSQPLCPDCGTKMTYRDCRRRISLYYGHKASVVYIRRFRCTSCNHLHNELPDTLRQNKWYCDEVIQDVLDGVVTFDDPATADGPTKATMKRWLNEYGSRE